LEQNCSKAFLFSYGIGDLRFCILNP